MTSILGRLTNRVKRWARTTYMVIPVTPGMLTYVLNKKQAIEQLQVYFTEEHMVIMGKVSVKKLPLVNGIPFQVTLKPLGAEGRRMAFQLVKLKPINIQFLTKRLLTRPFIRYENRVVEIDLNQTRMISKISVGRLKGLALENDKLYVYIGL